ncbi:MAG: MarR family transcriptional regulator [Actinomycetota bacterium]
MTQQPWERGRRALWQLYQSASRQLSDRLDDELQQHHDLTLVDYEILSELVRAPDQRLRMSDLANQVLVSRSRLTYRIDRLVDVGFVTREECEDDRRGMWAIISERGLTAHVHARDAHEAAIDSLLFDQMSASETETLRRVLGRISTKLSQQSDRDR